MLLKLIKTRPFISGTHAELWEINHLTGNRHLADLFILNEHLPPELIYRVTVNCRGICVAGKPIGWQWEERLDYLNENHTKNNDKNLKNNLVGNQKIIKKNTGLSDTCSIPNSLDHQTACEQAPRQSNAQSCMIDSIAQTLSDNPSQKIVPLHSTAKNDENERQLSYAERTERAVTEYLRAVQEIHEEIYIDVCQPEPELPGYPHTDYHPDDYPIVLGLDDLEEAELEDPTYELED